MTSPSYEKRDLGGFKKSEIIKGEEMFHLSHNYELGVIVLILAFLVFYVPAVYAFFAIRKQQKRKQNK